MTIKWGVGDPRLAPDAPYHEGKVSGIITDLSTAELVAELSKRDV